MAKSIFNSVCAPRVTRRTEADCLSWFSSIGREARVLYGFAYSVGLPYWETFDIRVQGCPAGSIMPAPLREVFQKQQWGDALPPPSGNRVMENSPPLAYPFIDEEVVEGEALAVSFMRKMQQNAFIKEEGYDECKDAFIRTGGNPQVLEAIESMAELDIECLLKVIDTIPSATAPSTRAVQTAANIRRLTDINADLSAPRLNLNDVVDAVGRGVPIDRIPYNMWGVVPMKELTPQNIGVLVSLWEKVVEATEDDVFLKIPDRDLFESTKDSCLGVERSGWYVRVNNALSDIARLLEVVPPALYKEVSEGFYNSELPLMRSFTEGARLGLLSGMQWETIIGIWNRVCKESISPPETRFPIIVSLLCWMVAAGGELPYGVANIFGRESEERLHQTKRATHLFYWVVLWEIAVPGVVWDFIHTHKEVWGNEYSVKRMGETLASLPEKVSLARFSEYWSIIKGLIKGEGRIALSDVFRFYETYLTFGKVALVAVNMNVQVTDGDIVRQWLKELRAKDKEAK